MTREKLNEIGGIILDASITVHKELGAGLLESAYEISLKKRIRIKGFKCKGSSTSSLEL